MRASIARSLGIFVIIILETFIQNVLYSVSHLFIVLTRFHLSVGVSVRVGRPVSESCPCLYHMNPSVCFSSVSLCFQSNIPKAIQGDLNMTLYFQNYTENKFGILTISYLYQSIEWLSKFSTRLAESPWYVLRESVSSNTLHSCITHGGPTKTLPLKYTLSAKISCIRRKWILDWAKMRAKCTITSYFLSNCRTHQLLCFRVAIFKTSGI
jgi:hypothetical protein